MPQSNPEKHKWRTESKRHKTEILGNVVNAVQQMEMKKMKSATIYECNFCGKSYELLSRLNKHKTKSHAVHEDDVLPTTVSKNAESDEECTKLLKQVMKNRKKEHKTNNKVVNQGKRILLRKTKNSKRRTVHDNIIRRSNFLEKDDDVVHLEISKINKCSVCGMCFKRLIELNEHRSKVHIAINAPYFCRICNKKYNFYSTLFLHQMIHKTDRICINCNVCSETFKSRSKFSDHYKVHTNENVYACDVCGTLFEQLETLYVHYETHTGEKPYVWKVCGQSFAQRTMLRGREAHTDVQYHVCDICDKSFTEKEHLCNHYRLHTGEKPYVCDICHLSFTISHNLKTHYRTHTGEKPYVCDMCSRSFSRNQNMILHKRIHTGERPHSCNVCGMSFAQLVTLRKHSRIHTGEKPYACSVCEMKFSNNSPLVRHKRRKNPCFLQI